jgi:ACT domain-containing protein
MRLRIVSDGHATGTKLYDADSGHEIDGARVQSITWRVSGSEYRASATLEIRDVEADVVAEQVKQMPAEANV